MKKTLVKDQKRIVTARNKPKEKSLAAAGASNGDALKPSANSQGQAASTLDRNSRGAAERAGLARERESRALENRDLTRTWQRDTNQRFNQVQQAMAPYYSSPDPSMQGQARSILAGPINAPGILNDLYSDVGVVTNKDLIQKGPELLNELKETQKSFQEEATQWHQSAEKAMAAAAKMNDFKKIVTTDQTNLKSLTAGVSGMDKTDNNSSLSASSFEKNGSTSNQGDKSGSNGATENSSFALGKGPGSLGLSSKNDPKLTDLLRRKLKLAEAELLAKNGRGKSEGEKEVKAEPGSKGGGRDLASSISKSEAEKSKSEFTMGSVVENENKVEKLVADLSSTLETAEASNNQSSIWELGSVDTSIFLRVKPPIQHYAKSLK